MTAHTETTRTAHYETNNVMELNTVVTIDQ